MKQQKYTIMFILLFALSGIAVWGISTQKSQKNPVAVIYQNNKEIKRNQKSLNLFFLEIVSIEMTLHPRTL